MNAALITPWSSEYVDYLRDESRSVGSADYVSFPLTEEDVIDVIKSTAESGIAVTTQGARTGIVAGAVPQGGLVLNLSRMKHIGEIVRDDQTGELSITAAPGVTLAEIMDAIEPYGLFFPPNPTEDTASVGGMVAANASGSLSFFYGAVRNWVRSLHIVLSDGDVLCLRRGSIFADGRTFSLPTESGRKITGTLPSYRQPNVKSAAGYYIADDMDMLDLFIGMEGTLGVITEIELRLIPKPRAVGGLTIFFPSENDAVKFVRVVRGEQVDGLVSPIIRPVAIEFFNNDALNLLRRMKSDYSAFGNIPSIKPHYHTAVNIEFHAESADALDELLIDMVEMLSVLGVSDEDTWYAANENELKSQKAFRHAVPEAVNMLIDERRRSVPGITKLGTDMSVPDEYLTAAMEMYNEGLRASGLESVIFGHIGDSHLHVNILPNSTEEYKRGRELYLEWARRVVEMGGSISAEHGIGKLKSAFLEMMYGCEAIKEMRELKRLFDPEMRLNPGTLFSL